MKINKIVIVGGGTAGWVTAHQFLNKTPKTLDSKELTTKITVVASEEIPIIGVGESTTGLFNDIINDPDNVTNTSDDEFLRETGSTYKIGIKHSDWHTVGESFYSPLGDDYYEQDWLSYPHIEYDNYRIYYVANEMPYDDNFQGRLMKEGKLHEVVPSMPAHAYHLDTYKTGQYLKQKAIAHEACDYVNGEVVSFKQDENGYVKSITTKTGQVIEGDLFVDCTGFSRVLIDKVEKNNFISYKDNLLVNSALTFNFDSNSNLSHVSQGKNYTHAWAQKYGWLWQIPTQDRVGCGYVFDDNYINFDQAQEEIEKTLGCKIEPQKQIKFDTGRLEKFWIKNVISTGLSSAFIEPLEATSIHCTILQIKHFLEHYFKKDMPFECTPLIDQYNSEITGMWDNIRDFIVYHYISPRNDTDFWIESSDPKRRSDKLKRLIELWKYRMPRNVDYWHGNHDFYRLSNALWYQIAIGMKLLDPKLAKQELKDFELYTKTESMYTWLQSKMDTEMKNAYDSRFKWSTESELKSGDVSISIWKRTLEALTKKK